MSPELHSMEHLEEAFEDSARILQIIHMDEMLV